MSEDKTDRRHAVELVSELDPILVVLAQLAHVRDCFVSGVDVQELGPVLALLVELAEEMGEAVLMTAETADRIIAERGSAPLWVQYAHTLPSSQEATGPDWGMRSGPGGDGA